MYPFNVEVVDSGRSVANSLYDLLEENKLLNHRKIGVHEFFVSDYTPWFEKIAKMFFEEEIRLELLNFWI